MCAACVSVWALMRRCKRTQNLRWSVERANDWQLVRASSIVAVHLDDVARRAEGARHRDEESQERANLCAQRPARTSAIVHSNKRVSLLRARTVQSSRFTAIHGDPRRFTAIHAVHGAPPKVVVEVSTFREKIHQRSQA